MAETKVLETFTFTKEELGEDTSTQKEVWTIYGDKGTGKTTFACGFHGTKGIISYDQKTRRIKERMYAGDDSIHVFDGAKFYRGIPKEELPKYGAKSIAYIVELLNRMPEVDWVVHDGLEGLIEMAEMAMRYNNNLGTFSGVDFQYWKDRKANLRMVHGLSITRAKKGVMYCTFAEEDKFIEDGKLIRQAKAPKWVDIIMSETDNVVRTEIRGDPKTGVQFVAYMQTIKVGPWQSGSLMNVTERTIEDETAKLNKSEATLQQLFG